MSWYNQSHRHSLASKGIKTSFAKRQRRLGEVDAGLQKLRETDPVKFEEIMRARVERGKKITEALLKKSAEKKAFIEKFGEAAWKKAEEERKMREILEAVDRQTSEGDIVIVDGVPIAQRAGGGEKDIQKLMAAVGDALRGRMVTHSSKEDLQKGEDQKSKSPSKEKIVEEDEEEDEPQIYYAGKKQQLTEDEQLEKDLNDEKITYAEYLRIKGERNELV